MAITLESRIKFQRLLPRRLYSISLRWRNFLYAIRDFQGRHKRNCSVCGYDGYFAAFGNPLIFDSMCPSCLSLGRHRQHEILVSKHPEWMDGANVLHFAPEAHFISGYQARCARYVRANFNPGPGEIKVDMQSIAFDGESFDTIIAHNVLEHVPDDQAALAEVFRVLKPGGRAIFSFPIVEAWAATYENDRIETVAERDLHFNQWDHCRIYGRDVRRKITSAGFDLSEDVAVEPNVSIHALERGETLFVMTKPA